MSFIQSQLSIGSTEIETLIGEDKATTDFFKENPMRMTERGTHKAAYDNILRKGGHNRNDREAKARHLQKLKIAIAKDKHTITRLRGEYNFTSQAINALAFISLGVAGYRIGMAIKPVLGMRVITDPKRLAEAATSCFMSRLRTEPFVNPYNTPLHAMGCSIINNAASPQTEISPLYTYVTRCIMSVSGALAGVFASPGDQLVDRYIHYEGSHHRREWLLEVEKEEIPK